MRAVLVTSSIHLIASLLCGTDATSAIPSPTHPTIPTLHQIPRHDWLNVMDHGAKGDGHTDDAAAIQSVIDLQAQSYTEYGCAGKCQNATTTIYFPPGVYAISKQLVLQHGNGQAPGGYGGAIVGHGAATTILWTGPAVPPVPGGVGPTAGDAVTGRSMLWDNGTSYFYFEGLTWDGQGKAAAGVDHFSHGHYGTWMRHRNEAFQNFTEAGVRVGGGAGNTNDGNERMATAEINYRNVIFRNCGIGIALYSYNDLDQMINGAHFEDCGTGIFCPHGNFYLYNSRFERSKTMDIYWGASPSSARRVVSVNSTMFTVMGAWCSASSAAKIEDVRIINWLGSR